MRYAIYGTNRVAKDFRYIFDWLDIVFCFENEDKITNEVFDGLKVYSIESRESMSLQYDKIIVCDFSKVERKRYLDELGLEYKKDYIYDEDLFESLDSMPINIEKRSIVVWGTGKRGDVFLSSHEKNDILLKLPTPKRCVEP